MIEAEGMQRAHSFAQPSSVALSGARDPNVPVQMDGVKITTLLLLGQFKSEECYERDTKDIAKLVDGVFL